MSTGTSPDSSDREDLTREVGLTVRARRQEIGMSIAELARQTGVSRPFISQLEAGRSSLSLPTLYRVAEALGVLPNALLPGGASKDEPLVTRAGHGQMIPATATASPQEPRLITRTGPGVALEGFHYLIHASDDEQQWYQHKGEDLVYVIAGSIVVEFEDGREIDLGPGDSLHHDGEVKHRWRLAGAEPAEAIIVNTMPQA